MDNNAEIVFQENYWSSVVVPVRMRLHRGSVVVTDDDSCSTRVAALAGESLTVLGEKDGFKRGG